MAINPADLLNQLPTVAELLEKPPIRALADRWNRSVVAGGVRSFLDEMRSELRRRAGEVPLPSIRELAERAARYVVSQQQVSLGAVINATGRLDSTYLRSRPLADAALERALAVGREFVLQSAPDKASQPLDVAPLLGRVTGATAAVAVHSYAGALWLAFSALAAEREVLVARSEVGDVDVAEPLPKLAAAAHVVLKEVGTINRATAVDYEANVSPRAAALLKLTPDAYCVVGETSMAEFEELVALSRACELVFIDALGSAPLVDPPEEDRMPFRSVHASLSAGADLVVVRGDGLVGGPECGILLGARDVIRRITEHPLFAAWRLDVLRSAALIATLECYGNKPKGREELPVWQFLATSVENLRNRAERMAPQLAHVEGIASAGAIETRSPMFSAADDSYPSYGVALKPVDGDTKSLDVRLRSAPLPIHGRVENDRVILDLRTVPPRHDKVLVDTLLGPSTADQFTQPQTAGV